MLDGGGITTSTTLTVQGGTLAGSGTITGNVSSAGETSPGMSPGTIPVSELVTAVNRALRGCPAPGAARASSAISAVGS